MIRFIWYRLCMNEIFDKNKNKKKEKKYLINIIN